ncbi:unannotated protein [freshwater metagenome]|uniref:Unannotated protein n=1 Tax=freshwater metagenome TaxID=449393 RepID=A0A6J6V2P4_9ZZZZ
MAPNLSSSSVLISDIDSISCASASRRYMSKRNLSEFTYSTGKLAFKGSSILHSIFFGLSSKYPLLNSSTASATMRIYKSKPTSAI